MTTQSKDISKYIECKENLENKLNIQFGSLTAFLESYEPGEFFVRVCGEIEAQDLAFDVTIQVAVYDKQKRVVATDSRHIYRDEFDGFDTFDLHIDLPAVQSLSRILVFPKREPN